MKLNIFLAWLVLILGITTMSLLTKGHASDNRAGAVAQELDTGDVTVKTVWRNGTDAVILIIDKETKTRCYAAYGSLNCVPATEEK